MRRAIVGAAVVAHPEPGHDAAGRIADHVDRRRARRLQQRRRGRGQRLRLHPQVTGRVAGRIEHADSCARRPATARPARSARSSSRRSRAPAAPARARVSLRDRAATRSPRPSDRPRPRRRDDGDRHHDDDGEHQPAPGRRERGQHPSIVPVSARPSGGTCRSTCLSGRVARLRSRAGRGGGRSSDSTPTCRVARGGPCATSSGTPAASTAGRSPSWLAANRAAAGSVPEPPADGLLGWYRDGVGLLVDTLAAAARRSSGLDVLPGRDPEGVLGAAPGPRDRDAPRRRRAGPRRQPALSRSSSRPTGIDELLNGFLARHAAGWSPIRR